MILMQVILLSFQVFAVEEKTYVPDSIVTYKKVGQSELRLHMFFPPGYKKTDKHPAIVFFFGGGWSKGTPTQFYPQAAYLASRGMVGITAEYRVWSTHKTSPRECVKDGKSAIRWLRQHAGELGIDPQKIAASGGSSGGHVAAATGTTKAFEEDGEDLHISSRPNALVLFNPVFDNGPGGFGYDRVKAYWHDISPMHNIDKGTPPTIVLIGTEDSKTPPDIVMEYKKRMENVGGHCEVVFYKGQSHGFFNANHHENYIKTLLEMDRFLVSQGYLKPL